MAAALLAAAAHISAVCPFQRSLTLGSAPRTSSAFTTAALPVRAAVMSAVSPSGIEVFGSAPAASSFSTMGALPFTHASHSGVAPYRLGVCTLAPAAMSMSAAARLSKWAAQ
jgi:hypothetical protein